MSSAPCREPRRQSRGFTLIELMIAVAIVVILASVALPSFLDSMRKSRRTEAFTAMTAVQQAQERWRSNRAEYTSTLADLGITSSTTTPGGYYTIAVAADATNPNTTYVVSATAVSGKSQEQDGRCARLFVQVSGSLIRQGSCASCTTPTFVDADVCWAR
jgi:type IV pilus assembly protein PilE